MNYLKPFDPAYCVEEERNCRRYTKYYEGVFAQGSGYLQIRGSYEEGLACADQGELYMRMPANVTIEKPRHPYSKWGVYVPGVTGIHPMLKEELVNLPYRDKKRYAQYSLGMKQRLAIALSVMHDPELLILDEPINGLDPIGIAEVRDFIRALCDERGKTILLSSHILSEIALLADDIGIIDHGVLLEEESLAELEQKNGKVLRFTVSNAPVAAQLLQQEMGVRDVVVESEQDLTVRDLRLDTGAAVRRFVEAGLGVSDAHLYEDTLEDYFKRITGGEGIA